MARKLKTDAWLFSATLILVAVGIAWLYSAVGEFPVFQVMWVALGGVGLFGAMQVDYRHYAHPKVLVVLMALTLAGLLLVFLFDPVGGGRRWIRLGEIITVQPSEFAKLVVILFAAITVGRKLEENEPLDRAFARVAIVAGLVGALILLEPDGGGAALLAGIVAVMMFAAGLSYRWVGLGALSAPVLAFIVLKLEPYRWERLQGWLDPWGDRLDKGYQPIQSMIAVGSGGWWGQGFMNGIQKLDYLPKAHNDYIYAVIAEEAGLVGASVVLLCFAVIAWRGLKVARTAPDPTGSLMALGITAMLGLEAFYNISVVLNILPSKGIPLPFVSAGGSSMLVSLVAMGVLLNISQQASATGS